MKFYIHEVNNMDITRILNTKRVLLDMQARNKAEAIEELTDLLQKDGAINCRETFIRDVWQRESEGSTGFENHIAIPHGKSSAVVNTTLAIGRTRQDIAWKRWMVVMFAVLFYLPFAWKTKIPPIFACCPRSPGRWLMMTSLRNCSKKPVRRRLLIYLVSMLSRMFTNYKYWSLR
jgi:hypothetical protein